MSLFEDFSRGFLQLSWVSWLKIKDSSKLTKEQLSCLSEISENLTRDTCTIRFKMHSKEKALEMACRHLGLFNDKVQVSGKDGRPIQHELDISERLAKAIEAREDAIRNDGGQGEKTTM